MATTTKDVTREVTLTTHTMTSTIDKVVTRGEITKTPAKTSTLEVIGHRPPLML